MRSPSPAGGTLVAVGLLAVIGGCEQPAPLPADEAQLERIGTAQLVADLRLLLETEDEEPMPVAPKVREELYVLGRALAHDPILSGNLDVSCTTCHVVGLGTDSDTPLPIGVGGIGLGADRQLGPNRAFVPRHSPALFNLHAMNHLFWDGRVAVDRITGELTTPAGPALTEDMAAVFEFGAVSAQAMFPVVDRTEMRGAHGENELAILADDDFTGVWARLMDRLGAIPVYVAMFEAAYPGVAFEDMTFAHASNAIAGWEIRAFDRADTPWDRFLAGDDLAMERRAVMGALVFYGAGSCGSCHDDASFSSQAYFDSAMAQLGPGTGDGTTRRDDYGRERVTGDPTDRYRFKSAPLRNVELTAPYGHAGQIATLDELMRHYVDPEAHLLGYDIASQVDDPRLHQTLVENRAELIDAMAPIMATMVPQSSIVDFLLALTDESARDLCDEVPAVVPSRLPVEDPCL